MSSRTATSFFASASKRIGYWLEHHPIASNSFLCLNLWVVGDILAQYSEHRLIHSPTVEGHSTKTPDILGGSKGRLDSKTSNADSSSSPFASFWSNEFDAVRMVQCASYGALVTGPILAVWYPYLDRLCGRYKLVLRGGPWAAPIAKVAADEFLMDPPSLLLFFGYMTACEGGSLETFVEKVRTQFLTSWCTSLAVWPVVLLGTFRFLPVPVHAPVINVCCIVWDGFLSHRNSLAKQQQHEHREETIMEAEKEDSSWT